MPFEVPLPVEGRVLYHPSIAHCVFRYDNYRMPLHSLGPNTEVDFQGRRVLHCRWSSSWCPEIDCGTDFRWLRRTVVQRTGTETNHLSIASGLHRGTAPSSTQQQKRCAQTDTASDRFAKNSEYGKNTKVSIDGKNTKTFKIC